MTDTITDGGYTYTRRADGRWTTRGGWPVHAETQAELDQLAAWQGTTPRLLPVLRVRKGGRWVNLG